jgi:hypothetical protein
MTFPQIAVEYGAIVLYAAPDPDVYGKDFLREILDDLEQVC